MVEIVYSFFKKINQFVLSLKGGVVSLLLAEDVLGTAFWQLLSCLENYFLGRGGEVALALSIRLYYQIVPTSLVVGSEA